MILNNRSKSYVISAELNPDDLLLIKTYILGAINAFCINDKDSAFSVRILFGGNNRNWNHTPLQKIYNYYIQIGKSATDAALSSAIDVGRLLKEILEDDKRQFEIVGKDTGILYKLNY